MDHTDHVDLLRDGVPTPGGTWADLGSGTGAFTLALAQLISPITPQPSPNEGPGGLQQPGPEIYSIDRNRRSLRTQEAEMRARFPDVTVYYRLADFARPLDLPPLDGIVMANSLHFVRDKEPVLHLVSGYLRPGGRLLVVEYDTDRSNAWVPHPFSYDTWQTIAHRAGFGHTRLLRTRPSRFLGRIYSALSESGKREQLDEEKAHTGRPRPHSPEPSAPSRLPVAKNARQGTRDRR